MTGFAYDKNFMKEHSSDSKTVEKQVEKLAEMIENCKHLVVFTGAGISTASGIPDFRGPNGVWTREEKGLEVDYGTDPIQALPSAGHMALVSLQNAGLLKFVISQNVDGLHRRSGIRNEILAELHGCVNMEYCRICGNEYFRDFWCPKESNTARQHKTGRMCDCGKPLYDTIINFGESLPKKAIENSFDHAKFCDLFVVLGSSLQVTPASELPQEAKANGAKLVICNLQKTPLDEIADLRIFAKTDQVLVKLIELMSLPNLPWTLRRKIRLKFLPMDSKNYRWQRGQLSIECLDSEGKETSLLKFVKVNSTIKKAEPFSFVMNFRKTTHLQADFTFNFFGNFNEPSASLKLEFDLKEGEVQKTIELEFAPNDVKWSVKVV